MARKNKKKKTLAFKNAVARLFIYCTIHRRFYPVLGCAVSTVLKNEFQYGRT